MPRILKKRNRGYKELREKLCSTTLEVKFICVHHTPGDATVGGHDEDRGEIAL